MIYFRHLMKLSRERVLAASNSTVQKSRPHTLLASGPPTLPGGSRWYSRCSNAAKALRLFFLISEQRLQSAHFLLYNLLFIILHNLRFHSSPFLDKSIHCLQH